MKITALLALVLTLGSAKLSEAHPGRTAFAVPVAGIAIDGQLGDWPQGMERYAIAEVSGAYNPAPPTGPQDYGGYFQVGYAAKTNTLYLAVVVTDDELVIHPEEPAFANQDLCEVYIDGDHSGKDRIVNQGGMSQYMTSTTSGGAASVAKSTAAAAQQYMMVAGPGVAFDQVDTNPALVGDEQHRSGVKAAFRREGTTTTYEWAIPLYASFPDQPLEARPGKTIGFDVAVTDADGDESGNWVSWSPGMGKVFNADLYGNLVLIKGDEALGTLAGTLTGALPAAGVALEVLLGGELVAVLRPDARGQYRLRLQPGEYTLRIKSGQGYAPARATVAVRPGKEVEMPLALAPIALPGILQGMIAAYQAVQTYSDTTVVEDRTVAPGVDNRSTAAMFFALSRPNKVRMDRPAMAGGTTVVSDGDSIVQHLAQFKEYIKKKAPAVIAPGDLQSFVGPGSPSLLLKLLLSQDPGQTLVAGLEEATEVGREELDGVPMVVVELRQILGEMGSFLGRADQLASVRLWIGAQDHLLHQVAYEVDMGTLIPNLPEAIQNPMVGMKRGFVERHRAIQVNPVLPAETFIFTPPAEARPVERFGLMMAPPRSKELVGQPAPAFALKNLEGQETRLADFAGQVLIVDFWATWCGPCKLEWPSFIALQSQYEGKGFSVIGLSTDEQAQTVRTFAEKNQINYPLLMADEKVRVEYGNITALPTTFLIDKQGVVRYTHLGTPPDMLVFQKQVEELLGE
ncbi:MAG: redoxin domain-containing protein [Candidatus Latescibacteria bacterium]|nr:redoxin domain-containing protein [Candidatus Latescibacterota bacterium]